MSMLVPGVLAGSDGPLLYPAEEVAKDVAVWNGMPITLNHPVDPDGLPVSARDPSIAELYQLGHVYRAQFAAKLVAEGWFDEQRLSLRAPDVLNRILRGEPIELSTGLFTGRRMTPGEYNGVAYNAVAVDYRPDHLAVLPDSRGACSLRDGCGVLINTESTMDRDALVAWLTTNCSCWKATGSKELLEKLTPEQLKQLKANVELSKKKPLRAVRNADGAPPDAAPSVDTAALAEFFGVTIDPAQDPSGFIKALLAEMDKVRTKLAGDAAPATTTDAPADATTTNRGKAPVTDQEWLATAPPGVQSAVMNAMAIEQTERTRLMQELNAIAVLETDPRRKELIVAKLRLNGGKPPVAVLQETLDLVGRKPAAAATTPATDDFGFATPVPGATPTGNQGNGDDLQELTTPTMTFGRGNVARK